MSRAVRDAAPLLLTLVQPRCLGFSIGLVTLFAKLKDWPPELPQECDLGIFTTAFPGQDAADAVKLCPYDSKEALSKIFVSACLRCAKIGNERWADMLSYCIELNLAQPIPPFELSQLATYLQDFTTDSAYLRKYLEKDTTPKKVIQLLLQCAPLPVVREFRVRFCAKCGPTDVGDRLIALLRSSTKFNCDNEPVVTDIVREIQKSTPNCFNADTYPSIAVLVKTMLGLHLDNKKISAKLRMLKPFILRIPQNPVGPERANVDRFIKDIHTLLDDFEYTLRNVPDVFKNVLEIFRMVFQDMAMHQQQYFVQPLDRFVGCRSVCACVCVCVFFVCVLCVCVCVLCVCVCVHMYVCVCMCVFAFVCGVVWCGVVWCCMLQLFHFICFSLGFLLIRFHTLAILRESPTS